MASQAQVLANRANALLSTGPTSEAGKSASSGNAYRHGAYAEHLHFASPEEKQDFETLLAGFVRCHAPADEREYDAVHEFTKARFLLLDAELEETQYVANLKIKLTVQLKKEGLDPKQHLAARVLEARATDKALRTGMSRIRHLRTHANRALRDLERFKAERRAKAAEDHKQMMETLRASVVRRRTAQRARLNQDVDELLEGPPEIGFVPAPAENTPSGDR